MNQLHSENSNELTSLSTVLLATLDQSIFFTELSKFISIIVPADSIEVYRVIEKISLQLVSIENETVSPQDIGEVKGILAHVLKTKMPYFSNNVSNDPMFIGIDKEIVAELCVPILEEGVTIAIVRTKIKNGNPSQFSRDDITKIFSILKKLSKPLRNIRLFMEANDLNLSLMRKIEETEAKLSKQVNGLSLASEFQVDEKEIIGRSEKMMEVIKLADKISTSDLNILIKGEAGTGKKILARRIHCRSHRSQGPFIVIDCSARSERDLDNELFGIERVGANSFSQIGLLEAANNGTIILHNVDALNMLLQSKLLRFIEDGIGFKSSSQTTFNSNARVMATTSANIENKISENKFREDLYYAIGKVTLSVPGLRDRAGDIEHLANFFLNNKKDASNMKSFSPSAIRCLKEHSWPGNIRELQNIIERADILSTMPIIDQCQLPDELTEDRIVINETEQVIEEQQDNFAIYQDVTLQELEQLHICRTLDQLKGNKTKTAKQLGITVKTLYNKLHSYGMIKQEEEA